MRVFDRNDKPVDRPPKKIMWDAVMAEKEGYRHYMLKEIHEQPRAVRDTFTGRMFEESGEIYFNDLQFTPEEWSKFTRVHIVACGTSWHAGLVGKFLLEEPARIPVEVDYGSEYRYRNPMVDENTLVIGVTQSGETADTIAGMQEAKKKGAKLITICNVVGSGGHAHVGWRHLHQRRSGDRRRIDEGVHDAADRVRICSRCTSGSSRGDDSDDRADAMHELRVIPHKIETILEEGEADRGARASLPQSQDFLFLGRGIQYPIALEGALKLKEISYIHAEGYPAGEMKHGPIALIDENMPVVAIATHTPVYDKVVVESAGSEGARRKADRHLRRRRRARCASRGRSHRDSVDRRAAPADPDGGSAAAARVPHRRCGAAATSISRGISRRA